MRRLRQILPILMMIAILWPAGTASACPNCKEAVSAQPTEVTNMAQGYNWSVLFMLAVPFTLFSAGTLMVMRAVKRGTLPEM